MPVFAWSISLSVTLTAMLGSADFLVFTCHHLPSDSIIGNIYFTFNNLTNGPMVMPCTNTVK